MLGYCSMSNKSFTFDEPVFMAGGLAVWRDYDYSVNPEGGVFPQIWASFILANDENLKLPHSPESLIPNKLTQWRRAVNMIVNSPDAYRALMRARFMILLLSVFCGYLVWRISTRIYGTKGGLLSLVLYSFSPTILANGTLITADMAAATAFLAAGWYGWQMLRKITPKNFILCSLTVLWAVIAKMSGLLIGPTLLIMGIFALSRKKQRNLKYFKTLIVTGSAISILIWCGVWTAYSFHFSIQPGKNQNSIKKSLLHQNRNSSTILRTLSDYYFLPEAYLYGLDYTLNSTKSRSAYMLGEKYDIGRWYFFPFTFLIKTPSPILLLILLSAILAIYRISTAQKSLETWYKTLWKTAPLWSFAIIYIISCLMSGLNIGHRHLLPLYPIIFIFCGSILSRKRWKTQRLGTAICISLSGWLIFETLLAYPDYIAFFNRAVGNKDQTYRLLSDSSLDWGQEMWNLDEFLQQENNPKNNPAPVYVSVLNILPPKYFLPQQQVITLPMFADYSDGKYEFKPGWYVFSATMLNNVYNSDSNQQKYQRLRLYLRERQPDKVIGHSLFIYKLTQVELNEIFSKNSLNISPNICKSP